MFDPQWTDSGRFLPKDFESEPTTYKLDIELPSWLEYAPEPVKQEYFALLRKNINRFLGDCLKSISEESENV